MVAVSVPPFPPERHGGSTASVLTGVAPRRRPGPDRATRHRRRRLAALVVVASGLVAGAAALQYLGSLRPPPADGPGLDVTDGEVYVVQPGDTLWTIAAAVAPDRDPRPVVDQLRDATDGPMLDAGERLVIDIE